MDIDPVRSSYQLCGARPASGSEHHLSILGNACCGGVYPILHGTGVGIGTVSILRLYQMLLGRTGPKDFACLCSEKDQWAPHSGLQRRRGGFGLGGRVKKNDPVLCQKRRMVIMSIGTKSSEPHGSVSPQVGVSPDGGGATEPPRLD